MNIRTSRHHGGWYITMGYLLVALAGLFVWYNTRTASGQSPTRSAYERMTTNDLMTLAMRSDSTNIEALTQMAATLDLRAQKGDTLAKADSAIIKAKLLAIQSGRTFNQ